MLRALEQFNIGISILHETKLIEGIYRQYSSGYYVWATEAEIRHVGGVAIARRW